jgi:hypothetical protein
MFQWSHLAFILFYFILFYFSNCKRHGNLSHKTCLQSDGAHCASAARSKMGQRQPIIGLAARRSHVMFFFFQVGLLLGSLGHISILH